MTSVNLAITMALTGVKVILIDADLRRPMIATVFGAAARSNGFGLLLLGNALARARVARGAGHAEPPAAALEPRARPPRRPAAARPPRDRARTAARLRRRDHHRLAAADRGRRRAAARGRRRHDSRRRCAWAGVAATSSTSCGAPSPSAASRPRASSSRAAGVVRKARLRLRATRASRVARQASKKPKSLARRSKSARASSGREDR